MRIWTCGCLLLLHGSNHEHSCSVEFYAASAEFRVQSLFEPSAKLYVCRLGVTKMLKNREEGFTGPPAGAAWRMASMSEATGTLRQGKPFSVLFIVCSLVDKRLAGEHATYHHSIG